MPEITDVTVIGYPTHTVTEYKADGKLCREPGHWHFAQLRQLIQRRRAITEKVHD